MSEYRETLVKEIKAAEQRLNNLHDQLVESGGIQSPDFFRIWSEIQSERQTIKAKEERLDGIGKPKPYMAEIYHL
jgi:hypothetical protein